MGDRNDLLPDITLQQTEMFAHAEGVSLKNTPASTYPIQHHQALTQSVHRADPNDEPQMPHSFAAADGDDDYHLGSHKLCLPLPLPATNTTYINTSAAPADEEGSDTTTVLPLQKHGGSATVLEL